MITTREIGDKGEKTAVQFLEREGAIILEQNYRYKRGEIDIVADHFSTLIFVEVKLRKNTAFGHPEEFLTEAQQDRIRIVAEEYCLRFDWKGPIRFDVLALEGAGTSPKITHFKDAF